jgi:hypothetical protein
MQWMVKVNSTTFQNANIEQGTTNRRILKVKGKGFQPEHPNT